MKKIFLLLTVTSIMFASSANAACSGLTCTGQLSRVIFDGNGDLFLRLADIDIGAESNCAATNNYAKLSGTSASFNQFYAMALTAYASEQQFAIRVAPDADCSILYTFMIK